MPSENYAVKMPLDTMSLVSQLKTLNIDSFQDDSERALVVDELTRIMNKLTRPADLAFDHIYGNRTCVASIATLVEAGVFRKWEKDGRNALSCTQLSDLTGVDVVLLRMLPFTSGRNDWQLFLISHGTRHILKSVTGRLCRLLASYHLLEEVEADDTYARTPLAVLLGTDSTVSDSYNGPIVQLWEDCWRALPAFLKERGFQNPTNVDDSSFQFCKGKGIDLFRYVGSDPKLLASFHGTMEFHNR